MMTERMEKWRMWKLEMIIKLNYMCNITLCLCVCVCVCLCMCEHYCLLKIVCQCVHGVARVRTTQAGSCASHVVCRPLPSSRALIFVAPLIYQIKPKNVPPGEDCP